MLKLLWARKGLFSLIFFGVVLLVMGITLILPKTYVSQVSVVIDSKSTDPVSGTEQASELMPSNIATQADVITSHNVALKVVEKLKMASSPELRQKFKDETGGSGSIKDWIADGLLKNVEVKPSRESHVLNIDISALDPDEAALIANTFADSYVQTSLELKMEPARRQALWYQDQLQDLRKSLERSQAKLSEYQRTHTVVGTNEQMDIENNRLAEISTQLLAAQATMYDGQARLKQMKLASQDDQLRALPDILANPLLQGMKADLARAEGKLAETAERFGKNHPEYVSAAAEVRSLQAKLAAEIQTAKSAIEQSAQQSTAQAAQLRHALDQQRDRILELKRQRDDLDVLRREIDSSQRMYEGALQRSTQVRLESQLDQSNIAILNPAAAPSRASRPKPLLNLILSIFIGAILAAGTVTGVEHMDRRVRSNDDLIELTGVVVLAEIPRRSRDRRRPPLLTHNAPALALKAR
jgi:chain length determinant protein EpsF